MPSSSSSRPRDEKLEEVAESEDEEPIREKRPRKRKPSRKKSSAGLIIGLVAGGLLLLLLVVGVGGGLLWYFARNRGIPQSEWQTFSPEGSGCSVLMPGVPVPKTMSIGGFSVKHYHVAREKDNKAFEVSFFDIPAPALPPNIMDAMVKGARDNVVAASNGTVSSETSITLGNLPGREFQLKLPKGESYIARLYLVKVGNAHRVYQIGAGGSNIQLNTGDGARFFDSFKIEIAAEPPNLDAAAPGLGAQPAPGIKPPQANPPANQPRPNPGFRPPRGPRRPS